MIYSVNPNLKKKKIRKQVTQQKHTLFQKGKCLSQILKGKKLLEVSKANGVPYKTLWRWVNNEKKKNLFLS